MTARERFNQRARLQAIKRLVEEKKIHDTLVAKKSEKTPKRQPEKKQERQEEPLPSGWVSIRDFSTLRKVSKTSLYNAVKKGRLSSVKIGKFRYINPDEFEQHQGLSRANRAEAARKAIIVRKQCAAKRREDRYAKVS